MTDDEWRARGCPVDPVWTLRDRFAAAALTGLLADGSVNAPELAELAYQFADAMLAEREKAPETAQEAQG